MKCEHQDDYAIGVDIESISRFRGLNKEISRNFLTKIFTEKELEYCYSKKETAQHLAARFTAKEAVIKALSSYEVNSIPLNDIEIVKDIDGAPSVRMAKEGLKSKYIIKVSLSHCDEKAIAFAIVEPKR